MVKCIRFSNRSVIVIKYNDLYFVFLYFLDF